MLLREERPDEAAPKARKALELSPEIALAHFALGKIYLAKGNTDDALKEFESEVKINPTYPPVYEFLGNLYIRTTKFREAQQALTLALSLDQTATGPFILMGKLFLSDGDPQTAATFLEHAEQMDSGNYITHYLLAQAYRKMDKKDMAKRESDIVSAMHSDANSGITLSK
jgi:tetratricopeptide (TPR) repeat protein